MHIQNYSSQSFTSTYVNPKLITRLEELSNNPTRQISNGAKRTLEVIREVTRTQQKNHKVNLFIDYGFMYLGRGRTFEDSQIIQNTTRGFKEIHVAEKEPRGFLDKFAEKARALSKRANDIKG